MTAPRTLLQMAGAPDTPSRFADSALVLIDCQMEYVDGALPLSGIRPALDEVAALLEAGRRHGTPIVHIVHQGRSGGLFDPDGPGGRVAAAASPADGETVIPKTLPNAFAGTPLHDTLQALGRREIIVAGFMTHMCVSSTVRAALDLGYRSTVVASAAATRDLPGPGGTVVEAATLHAASLAALADRFAVVAENSAAVPA